MLKPNPIPERELLDHTLLSSPASSEDDRTLQNCDGSFTGQILQLRTASLHAGGCAVTRTYTREAAGQGSKPAERKKEDRIAWMFQDESNVSKRHNSQKSPTHLKHLLISQEAMVNVESVAWQGITTINPQLFSLLGIQLDAMDRKPDYIMQVCCVFTF